MNAGCVCEDNMNMFVRADLAGEVCIEQLFPCELTSISISYCQTALLERCAYGPSVLLSTGLKICVQHIKIYVLVCNGQHNV